MKIDVEKLAREAGLWSDLYSHWTCSEQQIEHFARLVMEECAKVCSEETLGKDIVHPDECAEAIRARMP